MKVHYINILLFDLPLNVLVNNHKKPSITHLTPKIPITRLLCECELYAPANYDNDPQMKKVMENFSKQTQQRFHEYDDRMKEKRIQCKERCEKEIQKIILKDKMEKELTEKLTTLETKIKTDDIPTCICEKSLADKTEKFCLNCGKNMGAIAPWWGMVNGLVYAGWINAATASAIELATEAGIKAGIQAVIAQIRDKSLFGIHFQGDWSNFIKPSNYNIPSGLYDAVKNALYSSGKSCTKSSSDNVCSTLNRQEHWFGTVAEAGKEAAAEKTAEMIPGYTTQEMTKVTSTSAILSDPIILSFIAIVIVVTILLIIYLILRYRRKKKMKKKLQYIKLLEE
ncbi:PIR protein [Plasmodium reichenowi]|uniref:PIR protein n=1 Tax=Plasmodium reichenowi TaxID=5854 RepID=A0A2P9DRU3_PLARE|nr:PIR protein [Plasmodium reichenowi]